MTDAHPAEASLVRFARGRAAGAEGRDVVAHLLGGCEPCRSLTAAAFEGLDDTAAPDAGGDLDLRKAEALAAEQRAGAGALWERLESLPHARRRVVVRNSPRYWTLGLCDLLMQRALAAGFDDPRAALALSELAVDVAEHLDERTLGRPLVRDYQARALGYRANALRVSSDFRLAESLLARAEELLEEGTGDVVDRGLLFRFQAALQSDRGEIQEAIRFQRKALRLVRRAGDRRLENRISITLGGLLGRANRPSEAVRLLSKTLGRLEPSEPQLILGCRHNLALYLQDCGRLDEALQILSETSDLYREVGDRMTLAKMRVLQGELARASGRESLAEMSFRAAIDDYQNAGVPVGAGVAALELAALLLDEGRTSEVLDLAARLHRLFVDLDAPREALTAASLFHEAARGEALTRALLNDLRHRIERSGEN